jgi:hypothetical protein
MMGPFVLVMALGLVAVAHASPSAGTASTACLVVRDDNGQDVKIEVFGENGVRVRAVPTGGTFVDAPDVISALLPPSTPSAEPGVAAECASVLLSSAGAAAPAAAIVSGNIKAAVGSDGTLTFTRLSDNKVLLKEKMAWYSLFD